MKRKEAILYVQANARFMPLSPNTPYVEETDDKDEEE